MIYLEEIKDWRFVSNGKDFDNVVLTLNNGNAFAFTAIYTGATSRALRKALEEKENVNRGIYTKTDMDIGLSLKARVQKIKDKYFKIDK